MAIPTVFMNIEKLNEENYEMWKIHLRRTLILNDLWQYVDRKTVKPITNADALFCLESIGSDQFEYHTWKTPSYKAGYHIQASLGYS